MKNFELISCPNPEELSRQAAQAWLDKVTAANQADRSHFVALSGGRITLKLFAAVIERSRSQSVSWRNVHFFWADERCVPPEDRDSSYGVAKAAFLDPLRIESGNIHRVRGEAPLERATEWAIDEIKRVVPLNSAGQPVFDLIWLGMGEDGHVASLFPRETEDERMDPAIYRAITNSPKPPPDRVTLGYRAIAGATEVWVLVSGAGKEEALEASLHSKGKTPLGRVLEMRPRTRILSDLQVD